jgi:hypothetical protein
MQTRLAKASIAGAALFAVAVSIALSGCSAAGDGRDGDDDGASDTDTDTDTESDSVTDDQSCSEESKFVYVIDGDDSLYRFDPPSKTFDLIGEIDCPSFANPFSMSVTRDAEAHVLLQDGRLNRVSTDDASCEEITEYSPGQNDFTLFGMGYTTDGPDTEEETLYISNESSLGWIDDTWFPSALGPVSSNPELTGNGLGELWGFFPMDTPPRVAQLDKGDAQVIEGSNYPLLSLSSDANAWAFAFWGGSFYIFYKTFDDPSTNVYKLDDGELTTHIDDSGKYIVGAGVSTCAPIEVE